MGQVQASLLLKSRAVSAVTRTVSFRLLSVADRACLRHQGAKASPVNSAKHPLPQALGVARIELARGLLGELPCLLTYDGYHVVRIVGPRTQGSNNNGPNTLGDPALPSAITGPRLCARRATVLCWFAARPVRSIEVPKSNVCFLNRMPSIVTYPRVWQRTYSRRSTVGTHLTAPLCWRGQRSMPC